ncbi:MAG: DUF1579 domain-containing protein [Planctomycetota bacterium]
MASFSQTLAALLFTACAFTAPAAAQMPGPQKEHQPLAAQVGTWDAKMEYTDFTTGKAATSKGTSIRKQPLGGMWLIDQFQTTMMGMPFKGMGTTGYDPAKKKYVGTWIDSMTPSLMVLEGNYDKTGKILTMSGMGVGMDGKPAMHRMVTTEKDANTHVFEMFVAGPDGDIKVMTITYTRRIAKRDAVPAKRDTAKAQTAKTRAKANSGR